MEYIDRYVYAVTRRLPAKQREEIGKEISSIIMDMAEGYDSGTEEEKVLKAIEELGRPGKLAENYMDQKYLIGPGYFGSYLFVLKIVIFCIFIGISIATGLALLSGGKGPFEFIIGYISSLISASMQGAAYVTLIFYLIERYGEGEVLDDGKPFSARSLEKVPKDESKISRVESAVSIFFTTLFTGLILLFPGVFAAYVGESGSLTVIPVFDLTKIRGYAWLFVIMFAVGILRDIVKYIYGRWNLKVAMVSFLMSSISIVCFYTVFRDQSIYNPQFFEYFRSIDATGFLLGMFEKIRDFIVYVAFFGYAVETITTFFKGIKYND